MKPWIKIRRSVFFFMVAFGVGIAVVLLCEEVSALRIAGQVALV